MRNLVLSVIVMFSLSGCQDKQVVPAGSFETRENAARENMPPIPPDMARKELKYAFEPSDRDTAYIHFDIELTKKTSDSSEFGRGSDLSNHLDAVYGVDQVSLHRYKVVIFKGAVFEWKDIVPKIVDIIRQELAPNAKVVERKMENLGDYSYDHDDVDRYLQEFLRKYSPPAFSPNTPRSSFGGERLPDKL